MKPLKPTSAQRAAASPIGIFKAKMQAQPMLKGIIVNRDGSLRLDKRHKTHSITYPPTSLTASIAGHEGTYDPQPDGSFKLRKIVRPQRQKPLRRASKQRAKELRIYQTKRKAYLAQHAICEVCQPNSTSWYATEIHHRASRIGKKLNDETDWIPVCRNCHLKIHQNPSWARAKGLLK